MSENDIEILISTVNRESLNFLWKMFPHFPNINYRILIVNQITNTSINLKSEFSNIRVINSPTLGSSLNRNIAIQNAIGEIVVFADDDVTYRNDFIKTILDTYKNCDSEVILFKAKKNKKDYLRNYPSRAIKNISQIQTLTFGTIEITINLEKIKHKKLDLEFDENFGINSFFQLGEEPIFLTDLKKQGCKLSFIPKTIVYHSEETTSTKLDNSKRFYFYGAIYYRIFRFQFYFYIFLKMLYDVKHKKIKLKEVVSLFKIAQSGKRNYLNLKNRTI